MLLKLVNNQLTPVTTHGQYQLLQIASDAELSPAELDAAQPDIIELSFPAYKDGRAFTQARQLRMELGYQGDIRATGDVLRDQILFMVRCGFTSFEVDDDIDVNGLNEALTEFSCFYQSAALQQTPVWMLRQGAHQQSRKIA